MVIKPDPAGKEETVLCPLRKAARGGGKGFKRWDLRHCWHDTADDQQNGLLEEGEKAAQARLQPRAGKAGSAAAEPASSLAASESPRQPH